jgi:hypothetical protein
MAEPRYSDERQQLLERLARGKCSAVMTDGLRPRWRPTLAGEVIRDPDISPLGFEARADAMAAARRFKDQCQQQLAETNGSM